MTEYRRVPTKVERLRIQAAEAAAIREALQDPHVVALREERWRTIVSYGLWISLILGLLFTMTNVQAFAVLADNLAAAKLDPGRAPLDASSPTWWAYWVIDPMLSSALVALLFAEQRTAPKHIFLNPTARIGKWVVLGAIYVANTGPYWYAQVPLAIFLHSLPVIGVAFVAEVIPDAQDKISQAIARWEAEFRQRRAEETAEKARLAHETRAGADTERENRFKEAETQARIDVLRSEAGVQVATNAGLAVAARTGPGVFGQSGSDRSGITSQTGPGDRSRPFTAVGPDRSGERLQTVPTGALGPVSGRSERPVQTGPASHLRPPQANPADRSGPTSQTGPARRSGTVRKTTTGRSGTKPRPRPQTDADLLPTVRELAAQNDGEPPTKYALKQALGIGSTRAARLLDQLDPQPVGPPATNGAAKVGQH